MGMPLLIEEGVEAQRRGALAACARRRVDTHPGQGSVEVTHRQTMTDTGRGERGLVS